MSLPLIRIDESGFHSIEKNFIKINRYQTLKNKKKIIASNFDNINIKNPSLIKMTNDKHIMSLFQNRNKYDDIRKNSIFMHYIEKINNFDKKSYNFSNNYAINNNNIKSISSFSNLKKNNNSFEISTSLKGSFNKTSISTFINSLNLKKSLSDQRMLILPKTRNKTNYFHKHNAPNKSLEVINNIDKILTKFKINKLIEKNSRNYCLSFENNTKLFNEKIINTLFSGKFINSEIKRGRKFVVGKNETTFKKLNKHIIDIENSNKYKNGNSLLEIIESLNEKDIKIILADISYFRDINKNIVNILRNVRTNHKNNSLTKILNEEDGIKDEQKDNKAKIFSQPDTENEYMKDILRKGHYEKHINNIKYKDFNKRLRRFNVKMRKKKFQTQNVNVCDLKARLLNSKKNIQQDKESEYACFRSFFETISHKMTKQYFIENNKRRLFKEDLFQNKRNQELKKDKTNQDIISKLLDDLKKIHNK